MKWWTEKGYKTLKDITKPEGDGWHMFLELWRLCRTMVAPILYTKLLNSVPWDATPLPPPNPGQWFASKDADGYIRNIYHIRKTNPVEATLYHKDGSDQLHLAT